MQTYPLLQSQLGVFYDCLKYPQVMQYNIPCITELTTDIDLDRVEAGYISRAWVDGWCKENGFAPYQLFQAAFSYVLSRLLREEKVACTTIYHGRRDPRVKHFSAGNDIEMVNIESVRHLITFCLRTNSRLIHISTNSIAGVSIDNVPGPEVRLTEQDIYIGQNIESNNDYTTQVLYRLGFQWPPLLSTMFTALWIPLSASTISMYKTSSYE